MVPITQAALRGRTAPVHVKPVAALIS